MGIRAPQLALVLVGLALFVAGMSGGAVGASLGLFAATAAGAAAFVPVGNRTFEQWVPVAGWYAGQRATGKHRFRASRDVSDELLGLPVPLDRLRLLDVAVEDGASVAVVRDGPTYTAVLSLRGTTFALVSGEDQDRRVAAWGGVLAALAREGSPVTRVQWLERTTPDTGNALAAFWREAGRDHSSDAARSYQQLIAAAAPVTQDHAAYLAIAVDARRARRAVRQAGGGDTGATTVLLREIATLADQLIQAQLEVGGALSPVALRAVLRTAYEPGVQGVLDRCEAPVGAGPVAAENSWTHYRSDDALHATYWVAEWPRLDVAPDFLAPLLLQTGCRRTVALVAEPVAARKSARRVAAANTAELANQRMRDRVGQLTTERTRREAEAVRQRERELVSGHAEYCFSAYLTVTAGTLDELAAGCGEVETAARQSHLELRRLYGEQDQAFGFSLPLCRGRG